ncbi:helix-turn-helix transcriptional regulator [Actinoplanes sp. NPDC051470]|uniref:helix-turn-helix transcriptional regulator n=1 Tax=Actinoplanes sp. NPDC051470 TaxID=3157224 RepID=UPI003448A748
MTTEALAAPVGRWGLTPLAEVIYRTLVLVGPASSARLGRELGVEATRVGRGLDELVALDAVRRLGRAGGRTLWRARAVAEVNALVRDRRVPVAMAVRPAVAPVPDSGPPSVLTERERGILTLLAGGASDEEAAAELGLSRRTVLYAMRGLMDRLGVENRFQLALLLGAAQTIAPDLTTQWKAG